MLFMTETNLPLYFVKSHGASLFTLLYNSHDLLIMHVCDTFCDELAITYSMLFQSTIITLLLISQFS